MFPRQIETARLLMRPVTADDADAILYGYARDAEVTRYLIWRPHRTIADTQAYLAICLASSPASERVYAMVGRENGILMGALRLRLPAPHRIDAGYVLARPFWGHGLMTEALRAASEWALAAPGVFRIGAVCDVGNPASARVMEKAGLVREGMLKCWMVHPNISAEPRDCFIYGLTR